MTSLNFNANDVPPSSGSDPIPVGDYELHCIEANLAPAKSGKGDVLSLTFEVLSGPYANRKVWERMNVAHENPVAQKIGQEALSALCRAIGHLQVNDTEELLWKPFFAKVGIEPFDKNDRAKGDRNCIKKYHFDDGSSAPPESKPGGARPTPAPAAARATANGGSAPSRPTQGGANVPWTRLGRAPVGRGRSAWTNSGRVAALTSTFPRSCPAKCSTPTKRPRRSLIA